MSFAFTSQRTWRTGGSRDQFTSRENGLLYSGGEKDETVFYLQGTKNKNIINLDRKLMESSKKRNSWKSWLVEILPEFWKSSRDRISQEIG